ncbi:YggS family pyridoxal phosphate enzyme [Clostridia bacterium]|nr:YggS family pyridoxal phosphate enzyme [Clostridia bacterium]
MITENIAQIQQKIALACAKVGRAPDTVTLLAVSKTKPVFLLNEAYQAGIRDFGENKVQELLEKQGELPSDIRWHMIGHLQRNKVKAVFPITHLIHSVDSLRLAEEISLQARKENQIADILIEVNIAKEESKFGISIEDALELIRQIAALSHICVKGLMSIPPFAETGEANRAYFRQIRQLAITISSENSPHVKMDILSMGTSQDYTVAIEEGATIVRVGTELFGERNYQRR